jgi:hypothetical protein
VQHDVLRLDVTVDNPQRMDLVDRLADLLHNMRDLGLRHGLTTLELVVQLPARAHLQNDIDIVLVREVTVHLDDVGVVQELLYLQLTDELLRDLLLNQQFLLYHLQRTGETGVALTMSERKYRTSET